MQPQAPRWSGDPRRSGKMTAPTACESGDLGHTLSSGLVSHATAVVVCLEARAGQGRAVAPSQCPGARTVAVLARRTGWTLGRRNGPALTLLTRLPQCSLLKSTSMHPALLPHPSLPAGQNHLAPPPRASSTKYDVAWTNLPQSVHSSYGSSLKAKCLAVRHTSRQSSSSQGGTTVSRLTRTSLCRRLRAGLPPVAVILRAHTFTTSSAVVVVVRGVPARPVTLCLAGAAATVALTRAIDTV
jgi:hypothetical protein